MSTRNDTPQGIALLLGAAVAVVAGLIAYKLIGPNSPLRGVGNLGAAGEAFYLILAFGMPIAVGIGVLVYLWWYSRGGR